MARASRHVIFEGQYASGVLGTFRIIRGFANLKDLAEISVAYQMADAAGGAVSGQQRELDPDHAEQIKNYLERGERRFLPEVILSIRTDLADELDQEQRPLGVVSSGDDTGITIARAWKSRHIRVHRVTVDRLRLEEIRAQRLIRRVDGNHRLALAEILKDDPSVPTKYLAAFCFVLLGPADDGADDYSESLIFHTINSTALPLESEHALKLILSQGAGYDMSPEREFEFSPDLHFTRLLRDGLLGLPAPARDRLGDRPLTSLRDAVRGLVELDASVISDIETLRRYSHELLPALSDIATRLGPSHPALCKAPFFIELAARVWKTSAAEGGHDARVNAAVLELDAIAKWLGKEGLVGLRSDLSLSQQILEIYAAVKARIPRRVFLARWYPTAADGEELRRAELRLGQVRLALQEIAAEDGVHLELVDMGSQTGGTFPIHQKMYEAIASSEIIVIDLTGIRPNVCVEAGFAVRSYEKDRLIFMFQPRPGHETMPFDLATFRYERFTDTAEIPGKIKPHLKAILASARAAT